MKLRIKGDSLRIRVTQDELSELASRGAVEDRIRFSKDRALTYRLTVDRKAVTLSADFKGDVIDVHIPESDARRWADTDLVTLAHTQSDGRVDLRITIEKDFPCEH